MMIVSDIKSILFSIQYFATNEEIDDKELLYTDFVLTM